MSMDKAFKKFIRFFASAKMAVVILILLALITAIGTFVEANYSDALAAAKLVYHTPYMYGILGLLAITLIAVMVDRWPWKMRHMPFLLAHVGILVLLLGSWITKEFGIDGSMRFDIGGKNNMVVIPDTDLQIWSTFDGDRFTQVVNEPVDFFTHHPKKKAFKVSLMEGDFEVLDFEPYMLATRQITATDVPRAGSAVRFVVQNENVNVNDWILQSREGRAEQLDFGPAKVTLGAAPKHPTGNNEIFLTPAGEKLAYTVFYKDGRKSKKGLLNEGENFNTGWMNLNFKLLRYLPKAQSQYEFKKVAHKTDSTTSAIQVSILGKTHWLQTNDPIRIFTEQGMYLIIYGNRRLDLGFDLTLKNFEVGRYQGTNRAASYASLVTPPDGKDVLISMNEPLKYAGFTFYQASFQDGPNGVPVASILSVNKDPGRWIKYLGSLILSLGVVWLFVQRRRASRAQAPAKGGL